MPATAPALLAAVPDRNCAAAAQIAAVIVAVDPLMWNMRKIHFSHSCKTAAARMAVKGARTLRVHRSEAETLDGHRSGGYARSAPAMPVQPRSFAFNRFTPQQPRVTAR